MLWQRVYCVAGLAQVLVERAQLDEAGKLLSGDAVALDRNTNLLLFARSLVRGARGDVKGALEDQREARHGDAQGIAIDPNFGGWRLARLLHACDDPEAARAEADAALAWARAFGTPGAIGQALAVVGVLEGGEEGLAHL